MPWWVTLALDIGLTIWLGALAGGLWRLSRITRQLRREQLRERAARGERGLGNGL